MASFAQLLADIADLLEECITKPCVFSKFAVEQYGHLRAMYDTNSPVSSGTPFRRLFMQVGSKLLFSFVLLGMFCAVLMTPAAHADTITVGGNTYNITIVDTTYAAAEAAFESTPWYGNATLTEEIAKALGDDDAVNTAALGGEGLTLGPFVIQEIFSTNALGIAADNGANDVGPLTAFNPTPNEKFDYAELTPVSATPEPASFMLLITGVLGLGLLAGVKRYRGNHLPTTA